MDIGSMCICMAIGALIVFASIGIGVCFGRCDGRYKEHSNLCNKKQPDPDSDVRIYIYERDRNRDRNRHRMERFSEQEMSFVLHNVKRLTHGWEREIMDAIIEKIEKGDDDLK